MLIPNTQVVNDFFDSEAIPSGHLYVRWLAYLQSQCTTDLTGLHTDGAELAFLKEVLNEPNSVDHKDSMWDRYLISEGYPADDGQGNKGRANLPKRIKNWLAGGGRNGGAGRIMEVSDGSAGAGTSGWQTRPLTSEDFNGIPSASLAANEVTLPAGTYDIDGYIKLWKGGQLGARLWNSTDSSAILYGGFGYYQGTLNYSSVLINLCGRFTIADRSDLQLQYYASVANVELGNAAAGGGETKAAYVRFTTV